MKARPFQLPPIFLALLVSLAGCASDTNAAKDLSGFRATERHPEPRPQSHEEQALRTRVAELVDSLASKSLALSQTQRRYDRFADQVEPMIQLPATPQNLAVVRRLIAQGHVIEQELRAQKRDLTRLEAELAQSRLALTRFTSAPPAGVGQSVQEDSLLKEKQRIIAVIRQAAKERDREGHRRAFAQFMKNVAARKGNPDVATRTEQEVLGMPGISGLEEQVWAALLDPARAGDFDAILKAMAN